IFARIRKSFLLNASSASIQLAATEPDARTSCRISFFTWDLELGIWDLRPLQPSAPHRQDRRPRSKLDGFLSATVSPSRHLFLQVSPPVTPTASPFPPR